MLFPEVTKRLGIVSLHLEDDQSSPGVAMHRRVFLVPAACVFSLLFCFLITVWQLIGKGTDSSTFLNLSPPPTLAH